MASSKTFAQVPIRNKGDSQCPHHNTEVLLACIDCGGELVCSHCITSRHHRHGFENISEVADKKKGIIQEYLNTVEKTQIPAVASNLQTVDHQIKENTKHFKSLKERIKLRGEKMKEEIDKITNEIIQKCQKIEKQNYDLLSKYKKDLESLYTELNEIIEECKDTLKTANNVMIIDMEKYIQQEFKLPISPTYRNVEFTAGSQSYKHIKDDYGSLSVKVLEVSQHVPKSGDVKHPKSNILSEFTHSAGITCIEKSTTDSVWLSNCNNKYVSLLTLKGEVKEKLELSSDVGDISVSPVTGELWLCCDDNGIYKASGNDLTKCFNTHYCPLCLCTTPDNKVVVCTNDSNVTVYNTKGQVLRSTKGSGSVVYPLHVTVRRNTGDIAVCDNDFSHKGGNDKPHVSVFNSKLHLKYKYHGPPESVMKSNFKPIDVVYDTNGHLLIADYNSKSIQLLNAEGMFLTVVHTDALNLKTLTLIHDGLLCVGFVDQKVKVIEYKL